MEDELQRRSHDGWDEPVFYKGEVVGVVRRFSDTLLLANVKARRPEKYRARLGGGEPVGIARGVGTGQLGAVG